MLGLVSNTQTSGHGDVLDLGAELFVRDGYRATTLTAVGMSPEDVEQMDLHEGECVLVSSRRGALEVPVHLDTALRPGLVFMTFHFPDQVDTNVLTIEATDPKSGTAEFKATAIRIEKLAEPATV
jgi:formate dehydrogenase major subunit